MLTAKRFEDIDIEDFRGLVRVGHREDREIDYKSELPDLDGRRPADAKKELLKDVSAFANAGGGDIVFGVTEDRDAKDKPNGVPIGLPGIDVENIDALERRWLELIDYGLDPRLIPKPRVRAFDVPGTNKKVVLLRVPRSVAAPHMVKETGQFYSRPGSFALPMTTAEIRAAFEVSEGWARRVRSFRDERIGRLMGGERPIPVNGDAHLAVHVVPFAYRTPGIKLDLHALKARMPTPVRSISLGSLNTMFNVDGFVIATDVVPGNAILQRSAHSYTQYFREGCAEFVVPAESTPQGIVLQAVEEYVLDAVQVLLPALSAAGASYPFAVTFALLGIRGKKAYWGPGNSPHPPLTRDLVCMDDIVLDSEQERGPAASLLRPVFDGMWQCFGFERSASYKPDGQRTTFQSR